MSIEPNEQPGIVSVNDRGGRSSGKAGKLAFLVVVAGIVVAGAAAVINKYPASETDGEQAKDTEAKAPAQAHPNRRIFNTDALPTPTANASDKSSDAATICPVGKTIQYQVAQDGQLALGPSGQPILTCADGTGDFGVQPMPTGAATPLQRANVLPGPTPATPAPPPPSRYGGDLTVPQPTAASTVPLASNATATTGTSDTGALPAPEHELQAAATAMPGTGYGATSAYEASARIRALAVSAQQGQRHAVTARMIGNRDMIIPQGRSIDCSLTMRLVNDVSGMATCVLSSNVYSDSGRVVLAERGSTATGTYVATTAQGQRRIYVTWNRLQTPAGVVIDIDSPAADALGTTGLPGSVDNRWAERIGAAVMLSLVEDAIGYQTAKATAGAGGQGVAVLQSTTETGRSLAERILDSTINIKPTIYKHQGDRATIYVSRDLDFGEVYALRAK